MWPLCYNKRFTISQEMFCTKFAYIGLVEKLVHVDTKKGTKSHTFEHGWKSLGLFFYSLWFYACYTVHRKIYMNDVNR